MMSGIQNSINISVNSEENSLYKIFVYEMIIEINKNSAITISPNIRKNLETDITFSSFYIKLDSQIEFLDKYVKALTYFKQQKIVLNYKEFEDKFYDQIKYLFNLIEKEGISNLIDYILKFPSNEQNSFNYAVMVSIFINLGNFKIVEYLLNSIINSNDKEIENYEDLCQRLEYKRILKYNDLIKIDESKERTFIVNNFANIFSNVSSFNDIDEMLWRIISIRLSFKVFQNPNDYIQPFSNKNSK